MRRFAVIYRNAYAFLELAADRDVDYSDAGGTGRIKLHVLTAEYNPERVAEIVLPRDGVVLVNVPLVPIDDVAGNEANVEILAKSVMVLGAPCVGARHMARAAYERWSAARCDAEIAKLEAARNPGPQPGKPSN